MKTENDDIATAKSLVAFLKENYSKDDKVCYFDEGGAWIELVHAHKDFLGERMFNTVKSNRNKMLEYANWIKDESERNHAIECVKEDFKNVSDEDIVIY